MTSAIITRFGVDIRVGDVIELTKGADFRIRGPVRKGYFLGEGDLLDLEYDFGDEQDSLESGYSLKVVGRAEPTFADMPDGVYRFATGSLLAVMGGEALYTRSPLGEWERAAADWPRTWEARPESFTRIAPIPTF